jgi:hypothetical protein
MGIKMSVDTTRRLRSSPKLAAPALRNELVQQAHFAPVKAAPPQSDRPDRPDRSSGRAIVGLCSATVVALVTVNILVLAIVLPAWATGLCVSGVVAAVAAIGGLLSLAPRIQRLLAEGRSRLGERLSVPEERSA